jgi:hypothetical protein
MRIILVAAGLFASFLAQEASAKPGAKGVKYIGGVKYVWACQSGYFSPCSGPGAKLGCTYNNDGTPDETQYRYRTVCGWDLASGEGIPWM